MNLKQEIIIKTGRRKSEFTRAEIRGLIIDIFGNREPVKNQILKAAKRKKKIDIGKRSNVQSMIKA